MMIAPIMIDVLGTELTQQDINRIGHDSVGGVILFSRNYESKLQVKNLIKSIRDIKQNILIAIDHEGGRVQRFRDNFTTIPAMAKLGKLYDKNPKKALITAKACGVVLAFELAEIGVDFSFTPVLDVDYGTSLVIGDRAFHNSRDVIIKLSQALVAGIHKVGMKTVGKHFPGHGFVATDSHIDEPIDDREFSELEKDFVIFNDVDIDAIMPAHIIFSKFDSKPVCFSSRWLVDILKEKLGFKGCVFSDDLSMQGALFFTDINIRVIEALDNGCDMVLICNNDKLVDNVLGSGKRYSHNKKLARMCLHLDKFKSVLTIEDEIKIIEDFNDDKSV